MTRQVHGYSAAQIALHWAVVVLVAFQYLGHVGIETVWNAYLLDKPSPTNATVLAYMHIGAGVVILLLALARIYLRVTRGAPPPPPDEPKVLKLLAESVHALIYVLLIALPISGLVAWTSGITAVGTAHVLMKTALLAAIVLHITGALFQHFVMRSDVLMRMFSAQRL